MEETRGERIRRVRSERGLKQAELAQLAGVAVKTVRSIEKDDRNNQIDKVAAVMAALGLELEPGEARSEWPDDIQVIGDSVMALLNTRTPQERAEWHRRFLQQELGLRPE